MTPQSVAGLPLNTAAPHAPDRSGPGRTATLTLGAVGVVYGDIGTSPLYAFREALRPAAADGATQAEIMGVVSLLLWALILIVTLKYVLFLLRADNRGEGGILALFALVQSFPQRSGAVFFLGVAGAALFFGDAIITPAISVLSAVEGLKLVTPVFEPFVLPIAVGILGGLFLIQSGGTGPLARWFGPITVLWFLAMGAAGVVQIVAQPAVLGALNPAHAIGFLGEHGRVAFVVLGAVFLAVTGAEALYADLGHFGRLPIRLAWFALVFPALSLNYLGQGALVLGNPQALSDPFFLMVPPWALPGLVVLATLATVIASQAVITGAFSMTRQAIQLGLLPRFEIRHTSETESGQIFLPAINVLLLTGVLVLVSEFRTSSALAAAYGIAVSGTMIVTTALAYRMLHRVRRWHPLLAAATVVPVLLIEGAFFAANSLKVPDGGYVPLLLGAAIVVMMWTWATGTRELYNRTHKQAISLEQFVRSIEKGSAARTPGVAVFLTSDPSATPPALLHNLKHNGVLHEHIIVVTVETSYRPRLDDADRVQIDRLSDRFDRVRLRFGFMETPNVNRALGLCRRRGLDFEGRKTSFFLGRRKLVARPEIGMPAWQDRLYILMSRFAADPSDFYHLPRDRVVELGSQVAV
ncbi:potassium transporter Kup [Tropicimonas sediminicola]|uniref:Probable potassium transport system protein Kup n=1 Tax=Tropicimonas sediminicola TaxID=1031541 RepID=A0A239LB50_9RHOB|nr:potassium transporter Kup [Tropicimonas sediminicola]SNT27073.1 KUP system potassium uptake protein [Tropicimonas sediminicola]